MARRIDWEAETCEAHGIYITRPSLRGYLCDCNGELESGYVEKVEKGLVDGPESRHCMPVPEETRRNIPSQTSSKAILKLYFITI
jgi:hypothetical protein